MVRYTLDHFKGPLTALLGHREVSNITSKSHCLGLHWPLRSVRWRHKKLGIRVSIKSHSKNLGKECDTLAHPQLTPSLCPHDTYTVTLNVTELLGGIRAEMWHMAALTSMATDVP